MRGGGDAQTQAKYTAQSDEQARDTEKHPGSFVALREFFTKTAEPRSTRQDSYGSRQSEAIKALDPRCKNSGMDDIFVSPLQATGLVQPTVGLADPRYIVAQQTSKHTVRESDPQISRDFEVSL